MHRGLKIGLWLVFILVWSFALNHVIDGIKEDKQEAKSTLWNVSYVFVMFGGFGALWYNYISWKTKKDMAAMGVSVDS